MACPTKLTPELQEQMCDLIAKGNYREVAAKAVGVCTRTYQRWCRLGRAEPESIYGEFWRAIQDAEARAEAWHVANVRSGAEGDARLSLEFLARKFPERWGKDRDWWRKLRDEIVALRKIIGGDTGDGDSGSAGGAPAPPAEPGSE